jgi:hypothetical protein
MIKNFVFVIALLLFSLPSMLCADDPPEYRNWVVTFKLIDTEKLMTLHARLVAYDGVQTIRVITSTGRKFTFSYTNCSAADQRYLDTLDAPLDYSAIRTGKPFIFWYPETGKDSANGIQAKWAEGEFDKGKKVGLWKRWWKNGMMKSQGSYMNGEKTGVWQYWDESGALIKTEEYPEIDPSVEKN